MSEHEGTSAPNTIKKYKLIMKQLTTWAALKGYVMLDQLHPIDVREFRQSWSVSPVTAAKHLGIVKAFFEYALVNEWIDRNPARLVKLPRGKAGLFPMTNCGACTKHAGLDTAKKPPAAKVGPART